MNSQEVARRTKPLIDLTSLGEADDERVADALCARACEADSAAVCVWPHLVPRCSEQLAGSRVRIATVVNFPHGGTDIDAAVKQTEWAISTGAHEIDLVMPYAAWLDGERGLSRDMIAAVKRACGPAVLLKVILETGRLRTLQSIAAASRDAIKAGADFLKTSTGKIAISATPSAARAMLEVIHEAQRPIGFKAAGGIRSVRQAGNYLRLADRIMGPQWVSPQTFRFGASGLLANLEDMLAQGAA